MTEADFMRRAIAIAWRSAGHTRPNPPVGAVVVKGGRIVGEGRHRRCGGDHAEVAALKACKSSPKGATVYVTLEPCSKPGRVGACCDALAAAGVKPYRVYVGRYACSMEMQGASLTLMKLDDELKR
ncbi:MAG: dihydroxyacetone kinase subunit DhaK, partial [Kiritimatiellae bacterium]|nr:dihydroxyacetone kinase subunit DhaK [Kiritimatiellia bacterium]